MQQLAKAKARTVPTILRPSVRAAYFHRWTGMLAVAAQRALAATLLELPVDDAEGVDGEPPRTPRSGGSAPRLAAPRTPAP